MTDIERELVKHPVIVQWHYDTFIDCGICRECDGSQKEECVDSFRDTIPTLEQLFDMLKDIKYNILFTGVDYILTLYRLKATFGDSLSVTDILDDGTFQSARLMEVLLRAVIKMKGS
jgi:hypothetical protein